MAYIYIPPNASIEILYVLLGIFLLMTLIRLCCYCRKHSCDLQDLSCTGCTDDLEETVVGTSYTVTEETIIEIPIGPTAPMTIPSRVPANDELPLPEYEHPPTYDSINKELPISSDFIVVPKNI